MKTYITNLKDLDLFVDSFLESKRPHKEYATIISLSGDLGVGKTAFVKSCARHFSIDESITSPTFVIQKEYEITKHPLFKKLIHIDAYRLESKEELEYLGWNEIIKDPHTIICIEWPEQVLGIELPLAYEIDIEIQSDKTRIISLEEKTE